MRAFIASPPNRPGALAEMLDAVAQRGINIGSVGATTWDTGAAVAFVTDDEAGTRAALDATSVPYRETGVAVASLENQPGTLGAAAQRLGSAGINIEAVFAMGMDGGKVQVGFAVADAAAAEQALA